MLDGSRQSLLRVEGVDIHWVEFGQGRPVVFLHGLTDSHRTWARTAPAFKDSRRVLIPDLPGHGLSGRPDASYSIEWHARVMVRWMEALELDDVDVVAHSFGAGVAMWILAARFTRIRRIVLVSPGGLGREIAMTLRLCAVSDLLERLGQPFMAHGTRLGTRLLECGYDPEEIALLSWMNAMPGSARAIARTVRDVVDWRGQRRHFLDCPRDLGDLPPIAIVFGDRDRIVPFADAVKALGQIEGATLTRFTGCGHFPHRERPEAFVRAVQAFLDAPHCSPVRIRVPERRRALTRHRLPLWRRLILAALSAVWGRRSLPPPPPTPGRTVGLAA